jgi:hypothetical protein
MTSTENETSATASGRTAPSCERPMLTSLRYLTGAAGPTPELSALLRIGEWT